MADKKKPIVSLQMKETEDIKIQKFRTSGHFVDQKLQNSYTLMQRNVALFDMITNEKIKQQLTESSIQPKMEQKVLGIHLSQAEDRLLNCIIMFLHQKSDQNNYGNMPPEHQSYGSLKSVPYPKLRFTPTELYRAYSGKSSMHQVSQTEINFIKQTLLNLQSRKFLIVYKRYRWEDRNGKKTEVVDRIEEYLSLLHVLLYYEGIDRKIDELFDKKQTPTDHEKEEIIMLLNPIFVDQIDTKFIEYPADINQRMALATGNWKKVTESMIKLRDYLIRAITYAKIKRKNSEQLTCIITIGFEKLVYLVGMEKYYLAGRRSLLNQRLTDDITTMQNLGLINSFEKKTKGRKIIAYNFAINLDFPDAIIDEMVKELEEIEMQHEMTFS